MGFLGRVIARRRGAAPHCALQLLQLRLDGPFLISTLLQLLPQLRGSCLPSLAQERWDRYEQWLNILSISTAV